jgi:hypothetical protein
MSLKTDKIALACAMLVTCIAVRSAICQDPGREALETRHVLFVGDSFTHGRYLPVRTYNNTPGTGGIGSTQPSRFVVDENYNTTVKARMEDMPGEYGPWGGIPGIFAELAHEAKLPYDVHIEAISATTLAKNYSVASDVIAQPLWDAVVLQEASFEPIPSSLTQNSKSDPQAFCSAVETIERGIHDATPKADVYLYATWAPADTAYLDATVNDTPFSADRFLRFLAVLTAVYHNAYVSAAIHDGHIRAVAPVGDAWARAWREGVANPDPYSGSAPGVALSFGYQPGSEPSTRDVPTDAGFHHPSKFGAYLSGLVLFETITGMDIRAFGEHEQTAADLGISGQTAIELQRIAWEEFQARRNARRTERNPGPCTSSN